MQRDGANAKPHQAKQVPGRSFEGEAWFETMIKYEVIISWSEEDGAFLV